jgi:membrane fusion protein (multidrug efflux system)
MKTGPLIGGVVLMVGLLGVGGGLGYWKYRELHKPAPPAMMPPQAIDIIEVEKASWQPTATLVGTVVAKRSVTLANELAGVVREVNFESGDVIEPGRVLVKQDTATEEADLVAAQAAERLSAAAIDVAQADIHVAESDLEWATNNQKRFKDAGGSVSAGELDKAEADLRKSKADLDRGRSSLIKAQAEKEQAAAKVVQIRTQMAKKTLVSPFRALAGMRSVHPGQYLAEGTTIVGLMEITNDIYLDFAIPQEYTSRVVPGAIVVAKSNVLGKDDVRIKIISMDAMVNPSTRNVRVRSSIEDPQHRLKQGMSIDVTVPIDPPKEYVVVPTTAVRRAAFGDHVFVIGPGEQPNTMVAHQRMISVGPDLGGKVIINSGLEAGEKIAAGGSFKLREGAGVFPAPPHGPAGAGSPGGGGGGGEAPKAELSSK